MKQEKFINKVTFLLATIGGAIGIANLIAFPAMLTKYGLAFLICYVVFTVIIGIPLMSMEMAIGRNTELNSISAYEKLGGKNWKWLGILNIACCFMLFGLFMILLIWTFRYFLGFIFNNVPADFGLYLTEHIIEIFTLGVFLVGVNVFIVGRGIEKGIEQVSSILVPAFGLMLLVYALMNFKNIETIRMSVRGIMQVSLQSASDWRHMLTDALGQAFFSLSLGAGTMLTYAQYLKKDARILNLSNTIVQTDTIVALVCCLFVLPLGLDQRFAGSPLFIFVTLASYFQQLPYGNFFGAAFFLCLSFIVLTMTLSVMEPVVSFLKNRYPERRPQLAIITGLVSMIFMIPLALSFGANDTFTHFTSKRSFFDVSFDMFINVALPFAGLLMVIFITKRWGWHNFATEVSLPLHSKSIQSYLKACAYVFTPLFLVVLLLIKVIELF